MDRLTALVHVFLVFALTSAAAAAPKIRAAAFGPSTRPIGPVQECRAVDQPIARDGADAATAERLALFDVPAIPFEYELQLLEETQDTRVYRLQFPSPFASPFAQNNVVPAEYYAPKLSAGLSAPATIVLDILDGRTIVARSFARSLAAHGVGALYVPMAYCGPRRPQGQTPVRFFSEDPSRCVEVLRQSVMDIRRGKAILATRSEVAAHQVGITGVSLGGIVTVLAAGVDGNFDRVMPILSGGGIAGLVFHTRETPASPANCRIAG